MTNNTFIELTALIDRVRIDQVADNKKSNAAPVREVSSRMLTGQQRMKSIVSFVCSKVMNRFAINEDCFHAD